jgi:hypothetical protein
MSRNEASIDAWIFAKKAPIVSTGKRLLFHFDPGHTMINSYTTKIRTEDREKIDEAISTVESNIDFALLERSLSHY